MQAITDTCDWENKKPVVLSVVITLLSEAFGRIKGNRGRGIARRYVGVSKMSVLRRRT